MKQQQIISDIVRTLVEAIRPLPVARTADRQTLNESLDRALALVQEFQQAPDMPSMKIPYSKGAADLSAFNARPEFIVYSAKNEDEKTFNDLVYENQKLRQLLKDAGAEVDRLNNTIRQAFSEGWDSRSIEGNETVKQKDDAFKLFMFRHKTKDSE